MHPLLHREGEFTKPLDYHERGRLPEKKTYTVFRLTENYR